MSNETQKATISHPRRRLIEMMQEIDFGWMELSKRKGEPASDPSHRIVKQIKLGSENGPRPERERRDFVLKKQVKLFFAEFDRLEEGATMIVLVKHGLPFMLEIEEMMEE
jgi:hypothetical protein